VLFGQGAYIHAKALGVRRFLPGERAFNRDHRPAGRATKTHGHGRIPGRSRAIEVKAAPCQRQSWLAGSSGQGAGLRTGATSNVPPMPASAALAVYSAHRDNTHFSFLRDVAIGDEIVVTRNTTANVFPTTRAGTAASVGCVSTPREIDPPDRMDTKLVLSTCWPFDAVMPGPERYVLHASMISRSSTARRKSTE